MTNITLTTEQAQQIEEALEYFNSDYSGAEPSASAFALKVDNALVTIRAARAQEPVAEGYMKCPACNDRGVIRQHFTELERMLIEDAFEKAVKKAAPVQQVDLTDDEIEAVWIKTINSGTVTVSRSFARAVIAADREKNK